jgi:hypothetical protein
MVPPFACVFVAEEEQLPTRGLSKNAFGRFAALDDFPYLFFRHNLFPFKLLIPGWSEAYAPRS